MNNNETLYNDDELEIDLLEILRALKKKIWLLILMTVLCGGIAGAFSKFVLIPQYTSTAMVYILSKETTLTSLADLQIGSQLTKDYAVIVSSRPVLEEVIGQLGLTCTYEELKEQITIDNPKDTRILTISAVDPDPQMAKAMADAVANTSSEYIGEIMEMIPPKMIEDGIVPTEQTSPSNIKNALIGAIAGFVVVCGLVTLEVVMNDTVRTEEDVEKYLGVSVLAMVPTRRGEIAEDKDELLKNNSSKSGKSRKRGKGTKM